MKQSNKRRVKSQWRQNESHINPLSCIVIFIRQKSPVSNHRFDLFKVTSHCYFLVPVSPQLEITDETSFNRCAFRLLTPIQQAYFYSMRILDQLKKERENTNSYICRTTKEKLIARSRFESHYFEISSLLSRRRNKIHVEISESSAQNMYCAYFSECLTFHTLRCFDVAAQTP